MSEERVLGKDYVVLKGRGGREYQNGAMVKNDDKVHLSVDIGKTTICGKIPETFLLTYADVEINCPDCIAEIVRRGR